MTGEISPRTAELAYIGLRKVLQLAQPRRNGADLPDDVAAAFIELEAAGALTRTEVGTSGPVVKPFEQIDVVTAARRLGISVRAVQKRCARGTLPAERLGQRAWLINWRQ